MRASSERERERTCSGKPNFLSNWRIVEGPRPGVSVNCSQPARPESDFMGPVLGSKPLPFQYAAPVLVGAAYRFTIQEGFSTTSNGFTGLDMRMTKA